MLKSHYTHTLCAFFLSLYCPLKLLVESGNHENTFHIKTFTRNSPNVARELFGFFMGLVKFSRSVLSASCWLYSYNCDTRPHKWHSPSHTERGCSRQTRNSNIRTALCFRTVNIYHCYITPVSVFLFHPDREYSTTKSHSTFR